jgi:hypothetical protein
MRPVIFYFESLRLPAGSVSVLVFKARRCAG